MRVRGRGHRARTWATHALLIGIVTVTLAPFAMVVSTSLTPGNFGATGLVPERISFEHWRLALGFAHERPDGTVREPPFPVLLWLWNSVKVAAVSGVLILALSTTAAYAFARLRFAGKGHLLTGMLVLQMFPAALALIAFFALFDAIGAAVPALGLDTHGALILAYVSGIALHVWTIKGYFETLPTDLDEAALMDGASRFQAFRFVVLPLATPILAVVFILAFIAGVNEYPVASVLLQSEGRLTLAVGSKQYLQAQNFLWGDFAAAALLSGLPITGVFLLARRWIVGGLSAGAVKG